MPVTPGVYGVLAEFGTADDILHAARRARAHGYQLVEAYTPYPVDGLAEELGFWSTSIPFVVLVAGIIGAGVGFLMMYWTMAIDYPFDVGGRPLNSWPVYVPIAFEVMILVASFSALFGMMFMNGLPRLNRPIFNVPHFTRATQDRFFLCIESSDPRFDPVATKEFLAALGPYSVVEVPD
jgi:hypothetical protein